MSEIITIGSALVDIFVKSNSFQVQPTDNGTVLCQVYGDKVDVEQFAASSGGGGSNTAVGFKRMGFTTAVVAELGNDSLTSIVTSELETAGVETQWLIREHQEQTGGSVVLIGPDGGRTVMVHRGAASQLGINDIPFDELGNTRWVHLGSIGGHQDILERVFALIPERQIHLSWNPGKAELELLAQGVFPSVPVEILLVNEEEWGIAAPVQEKLLQQIPIVVVTQGRQGGRVLTREGAIPYTAPQVRSIDDTGAGDAFAVGFVTAHILGKSPTEAARWGSLNASAVVQQLGAKPGLLQRAELETIAAANY